METKAGYMSKHITQLSNARRSQRIAGFSVHAAYKPTHAEKPIVKDYLHDGTFRLEYAMRKVSELPAPNKDYALEYKRNMELADRKERTQARRLHELRFILKLLDKDARQATKKDIEDLVLRINKHDMALTSKAMTKLTLKNFYKYLYGVKGKGKYPEIVDWIEIKRPKGNSKLPEDLPTLEEMVALIDACKTPRDRCVIAIMANFGCRIGELLALRYKDITIGDPACWVRLNGKTGARSCPFVPGSLAYPYIIEYLNRYKPKDANAPLFLTKDKMPLDYKNVRRLLQHLQEWTGLKKHLHPHLFRHFAATAWAGVMTEQRLKMYMGWQPDSRMAAIYVHGQDKDLIQDVQRASGLTTIIEERARPKVKPCARCKEINAITNVHCSRCGYALDTESIKRDIEDAAQMKARIEKLEEALQLLLDRVPGKVKREILHQTPSH